MQMQASTLRAGMRAAGVFIAGSAVVGAVIHMIPEPWQAIAAAVAAALVFWAQRAPGHVDAADPVALRVALAASVRPPPP